MNRPREIAPHIRAQQHKASDPEISIWVSANAGSGKTHVLTQRVLRHLLAGVPPAKILCLTFTKAAAANMASRVFASLAKWTELDDDALALAIEAVGAARPKASDLVFARRLFARAVETPGGLKIQTIHAFCERLLHLFPFEANVPARFEVLDDHAQAELLDRARREILAEAREDTGELGSACAFLAEEVAQREFDDLIRTALNHRALFRDRSAAETAADLRSALALRAEHTVAAIECDMLEGGIAPQRWRDFAAFLQTSRKSSDGQKAELFLRAAEIYGHRDDKMEPQAHLFSVDKRQRCLACYFEIFFTQGGDGPARAKLLTADLAKTRPDLAQALENECMRLNELRDLRRAAETFERSYALNLIVQKLLARYQKLKSLRGMLDFDDLIDKTSNLLARSDARWVLYKLDSGIDHILVDEAQDTSEAQWKILEDLTGEFAAGASSRALTRTFFAVGDEKQSIFSFQGAAPHMFHAMRERFRSRFSRGGARFEHVQLKDSFRSVPSILATVDEVFAIEEHQKGLVTNDQWMGHSAALKHDLPGLVEIWPTLGSAAEEDPREWQLPLDVKGQADPANILAHRVAQKIAMLIAPNAPDRVADADHRQFRRIRPSDILILVRTRNAFFDAIIRALKQSNVPVAGADRLVLTEHIAIMDLMAVGRVAHLPRDDLSLACVLKSPLIGFDDEDLLRLAPQRHGSLYAALRASEEARDRAAAEKIARWRNRAALPPFVFYARLLSEDGGRRAIEARMGPEACDALDEFLRLALEAERDGNLSLVSFIAGLEGVDFEVKRDMESLQDCVRVMTVHAAKGLEAKIVFLPDLCSAPAGHLLPKLFALSNDAGEARALAWSPRKDGDPPAVAAARARAREAAEDEYRRLLYVALTRAEERLYLCGFHGTKQPVEQSWIRMIQTSLGGDFEKVPAFWNSEEMILRRASHDAAPQESAAEQAVRKSPTTAPDWLSRPPPRETAPQPPLRPSTALAAAEADQAANRSILPAAALERGRIMHVLLQHLPQVSPTARRQAAHRFLQTRAANLDAEACAELIDEAMAVLDLPQMRDLFGPRSRAEVAVAGRLPRDDGTSVDIAGQIDRIVETETAVLIADFKTGSVPDPSAVPQAFVAQMALYRAVLAPLWPDKRLTMLLIFTAEGKIVELAEAQLTAALRRLGFKTPAAP